MISFCLSVQKRLHQVPGKGKTGLHNRGVTFWLPVAKLGPLPKTPNDRAMPKIPPDLASPLPLNPWAHSPQDGLCPQYSAAYLKLGLCLRSPGMFGGEFSGPRLPPFFTPAHPAGVWNGSMGGGRRTSFAGVSTGLVIF